MNSMYTIFLALALSTHLFASNSSLFEKHSSSGESQEYFQHVYHLLHYGKNENEKLFRKSLPTIQKVIKGGSWTDEQREKLQKAYDYVTQETCENDTEEQEEDIFEQKPYECNGACGTPEEIEKFFQNMPLYRMQRDTSAYLVKHGFSMSNIIEPMEYRIQMFNEKAEDILLGIATKKEYKDQRKNILSKALIFLNKSALARQGKYFNQLDNIADTFINAYTDAKTLDIDEAQEIKQCIELIIAEGAYATQNLSAITSLKQVSLNWKYLETKSEKLAQPAIKIIDNIKKIIYTHSEKTQEESSLVTSNKKTTADVSHQLERIKEIQELFETTEEKRKFEWEQRKAQRAKERLPRLQKYIEILEQYNKKKQEDEKIYQEIASELYEDAKEL